MKLLLLKHTGLITQTDLENVLQYDAQIARLQETRDRIAAGVLYRLAAGVDVEGGRRSIDINESYEGDVRMQKLIVR